MVGLKSFDLQGSKVGRIIATPHSSAQSASLALALEIPIDLNWSVVLKFLKQFSSKKEKRIKQIDTLMTSVQLNLIDSEGAIISTSMTKCNKINSEKVTRWLRQINIWPKHSFVT